MSFAFPLSLVTLLVFQFWNPCHAAYITSSDTDLGTCASSKIISRDITCHTEITYDDPKEGRITIGGHITTESCDLDKLCETFADRAKLNNPSCTKSFCCNRTTLCSEEVVGSGQPGSALGGVSLTLVLSTLAISFAKYL